MSDFHVEQLDHIHVDVEDRQVAAEWFQRVLGLVQATEFASWADDPKGPLFLKTRNGDSCLALFTKQKDQVGPLPQTIAFRVSGSSFLQFVDRLNDIEIFDKFGKPLTRDDIVDHKFVWSLYFVDPDGNRFELTTYNYGFVAQVLESGQAATRR